MPTASCSPGRSGGRKASWAACSKARSSVEDGKLYPEITGSALRECGGRPDPRRARPVLLRNPRAHGRQLRRSHRRRRHRGRGVRGGMRRGRACRWWWWSPVPIGGGATAAGMGHIVVMDDSPAQIALTHYSRQLVDGCAGSCRRTWSICAAGTLWVAADEEEMAEVRRKRGVLRRRSACAPRCWTRAALAEAEPHLRPGLAGALLVPDDAVIYPPCAARYLLERASAKGAVLRWAAVRRTERRGRSSCAMARCLAAGITVNATGAWAPELTPGIEVRKRKGHLVITDRYPGFVRASTGGTGLSEERAFDHARIRWRSTCSRASTGQVLIGSSRQFGAETAAIDQSHADAHAAARAGVHAGARGTVGDPLVDGLPRGHAGQAAADRAGAGGSRACIWRRATKGWASRRRWRRDELVADQIVGADVGDSGGAVSAGTEARGWRMPDTREDFR